MKEEFKDKQDVGDKVFAKKIKSFHMGRTAELFPGVTLDVNEHEFVELMLDLDQVYDTAHRLNVVLIKYTRSIESMRILILINIEMSKLNSVLGPQAIKIYPQGHVNHPVSSAIQQSHTETNQYYKDFMLNHKQTCDQFKVFFTKFDVIYVKLKQRDKSLEKFKYYFEKVRKLREDNKHKKNNLSGAAAIDPAKLSKEEEKLARVSFLFYISI